MMDWIPDFLTASRLLLAGIIIVLGATHGRQVTPVVVILVIVAWTTDNLDGFIARRIPKRPPSWLGRHDFAIDVIFTWATLVYILLAGFLAWWLGIAYTLVAFIVAWRAHRKPITILFLRLVDVTAAVLVLWYYPMLGLVLMVFLLLLAAVQWPRLSRDSVIWAKTMRDYVVDVFRGRNSVS
jgi:phosphatidylglycerophosphate synthase